MSPADDPRPQSPGPGLAFGRSEPALDDETWRALTQWTVVPSVRLGPGGTGGTDGRSDARLVVAVAHPDDETLACGGLLARAAEHDLPTVVVVATDGEASHPGSPSLTPGQLAGVRRGEVAEAVSLLHPAARLVRLGLPDGGLDPHRDTVAEHLRRFVDAETLLVSTYRHDGHVDHEVVAQAAAEVAAERGARHLEAPIWLWHWGTPDDVPWSSCTVLPLTPGEQSAKAEALGRHRSQTAALSSHAADAAVLTPGMLAAFRRPFETFVESAAEGVTGTPHADVFEELHQREQDPWRTATSWYEARRRALVLGALPWPKPAAVLEIGCSTGELTAALAERAGEVVAVDVSPTALSAAARRCAGLPVRLERMRVPEEWPEGTFDVVVVSEVGYFLTGTELVETLWKACRSLAPDGSLLLAHWRHEIEDWPLDGVEVHEVATRVAAEHGLSRATRVVDDDVLVDLYRPVRRRTVAQEERERSEPGGGGSG